MDSTNIPFQQQTFSLVDGCFDPLHRGHIEYFSFATTLGLPVVCCIAPDAYIRNAKHREPLLCEQDRLAVIGSLRQIDGVCVSLHGTVGTLKQLVPRYYIKGKDWQGGLPPAELAACQELGIEVVYADCALQSSSKILQSFLKSNYERTEF